MTDESVIAAATTLCRPISDMSAEGLHNLGKMFLRAHRHVPGGLSIEVGTRGGGSALLQLALLEYLYPGDRPMLFTVDPYGGKPYDGGDVAPAPLYGDTDFLNMKLVTHLIPNHVHWYCRGEDFLEGMARRPYWRDGRQLTIDKITFALLDGEHAATIIEREFALLLPLMAPGGIIMIDNVDKDPATKNTLKNTLETPHATWIWLPLPDGEQGCHFVPPGDR